MTPDSRVSDSLIDSNTIRFGPSGEGPNLGLKEVWEHRELLVFLLRRDVKVRYQQTLLGSSWAVLQPLLLMTVFWIFLGELVGVDSGGIPYPLFAFAALVPWTLFAQGLGSASASLVNNEHLISKVYFPRLILPLAAAGAHLVDFAIAFVLLLIMATLYGFTPTPALLLLPAFTLLAMLASLSIGLWLSAINVKYRDVRYAVPYLIQVWLFASPVAYSSGEVPTSFRLVYGLNPMAGVVEGFRWSLTGLSPPSGSMILVSTAVTLIVLGVGLLYFKKTEQSFADVI